MRLFLRYENGLLKLHLKPRPKLPYEHPDVKIYQRLFKENIIRRLVRKSAYHRHDNAIADFLRMRQ